MGEKEKQVRQVWPDQEALTCFVEKLRLEERSDGTIEKYVRDVTAFGRWLAQCGFQASQETGNAWKSDLLVRGYSPITVNSMVCAVNSFFRAVGKAEIRIRSVRTQKKMFWEAKRELSTADFKKLLHVAQKEGRRRLALVLETIAGTGIRVSELPYITVEAVMEGRATIHLKGKIRVILLPKEVRKQLKQYIKEEKVQTGSIFLTKRGAPISRKQIWAEMKALAKRAGVEASKVFPHNLRHLFARCFYGESHDLVGLSNLLGHSSVETTRIYLLTSEASQQARLDRLRLIC